MAEDIKIGCARPTGGLVGETRDAQIPSSKQSLSKEAVAMIKVGKKAPDFSAPAYHQGKFVSVKLSEYLGKWVSTRAISRSSEPPRFRQLPENTRITRSWGWRSFP